MANYKKKSFAERIGVVIVCIVLLAVAALAGAWGTGYALTGEANPANWKSFKPSGATATHTTVAVSSDGQLMENGEAYEMPAGFTLLSARSFSSETTEYVSGGEITLTARLSNEYINGKFDWLADWANPDAEWVQGKVATYYVALEPSEDGKEVTVNYLEPFSEQIIITATLQGSDSSDTCTVDCLKMVRNKAPYYFESDDMGSYLYEFSASLEFDAGTVEGDYLFKHAAVYLTDDFKTAVQNYLTFTLTFTGAVFDPDDYEFTTNRGTINGRDVVTASPASNTILSYSMFIKGFDDYDQAHKDAIYYAWFHAFTDGNKQAGVSRGYYNVLLDLDFIYCCAGVTVSPLYDSDIINSGSLTGEAYGADVEPSVTLNKNVVF